MFEVFFALEGIFFLLFLLTVVLFLLFLVLFFSPSSLKAAFTWAPFMPTSKKIIRKALKIAELKEGEKLYDLGCGNGRVLVIAGKEFGARVVGFEYSFPFFCLSKVALFVNRIKNGAVYNADFYDCSIKDADVVYLFLTPKAIEGLEPNIKKQAKTGARIITFSSHFRFWHPDKVMFLDKKSKPTLCLYIKKA